MKRKPCVKDESTQQIKMSLENLRICVNNQQESFQSWELNQSLHLQFYGFSQIGNLQLFPNLNTLFLNNNVIEEIQGISHLHQLKTLNLAHNRIKKIQSFQGLTLLYTLDLSNNMIAELNQGCFLPLTSLHILKLHGNKLSKPQSIYPLTELGSSLQCLDLSSNQELEYHPAIFEKVFDKLTRLATLSLQDTKFCRQLSHYRKQMISKINTLVYLNDRPVNQDQKMISNAWKDGGSMLENEIKIQIRAKKIQKSDLIYKEIEEKNLLVDIKRKQVYDKMTYKESQQLNQLLKIRKDLEGYEIMEEEDKNILNLKIQDLQKYLILMKEQIKNVDLEKQLNEGKLEAPKMIIDKVTEDAIYVYNVSQQQIPLIISKYYPNETRPVIAVNYQKPKESRWIQEYSEILHNCYEECHGNLNLLEPSFNLTLYDYDLSVDRKIKRFQLQELKQHLRELKKEEEHRQRSIDTLNQLD